jgi:alpha-galactosidase
LWASIGLVDGVRVGRDVGVTWSGDLSAQSLLRDQACRNFANHILWQSDPDCVLLRERFSDLSEEEIKSLAIYAGMTGGVMMTSDHLGELSSERLNLWRLVLPEQRDSCNFPLLGRSDVFYDPQSNQARYLPRAEDAVLVQVRPSTHAAGIGAIFILNTSNHTVQRSYSLADLGVKDSVYLYSWENQISGKEPMTRVAVKLSGHQSALFFFSDDPINDVPFRLPP